MANFFKRSIEWGGSFTTAWGLLPATWQTAATAAMSGIAVYFGLKEVGIAQAIFYASGVLAFGMSVVFLSLQISQILGMFQRLSISHIGILNVSLLKNNTEVSHLNAFFLLRNDSQRMMFYKLKRAYLSIDTRGPTNPDVDRGLIIIPPFGGSQSVNLATIQSITINKDRPAPAGVLEVEVEYGDEEDNLEYLFHYIANIQLLIGKQGNDYVAQLGASVKLIEHSRK